jgi:hypothetical protein
MHARTHEHSGGVIHRDIYQMASYIQILTSRLKSGSSANTPSPTYAPIPPPPAVVIETPPPVVIETPPPVAPEVVEAPVEVPTVEETPAPSDENLDSEIV